MQENIKPQLERRAKLVFILLLTGLFSSAFFLNEPELSLLTARADLDLEEAEAILSIDEEMPDFSSMLNVELKKQAFFEYLLPYINEKNEQILKQREVLLTIIEKVDHGLELDRSERLRIRQLSNEYKMDTSAINDLNFLDRLLRRIDIIPPSLALAQAANESGWGTSRFAQEGNNFFGQWCYSEGCGLVPSKRKASATHEVKAFDNIGEAVSAYIMNLNTFPSYLDLRLIRENLRLSAEPIDGISLTRGLGSYSERGEDYIDDLQTMIYFNRLLERDEDFIH